MQTYRLAVIGFGAVGQGLAQILHDQGDELARRFGARFQIVAICDPRVGSIYDPAGLRPAELLGAIRADGNLSRVAAPARHWDAESTIAESNADVVAELSYTDLRTGEPALSYMRLALNLGKHVVTTNKGPIALHYSELSALARAHDAEIGAEGTVMSGTPTMRFGQELLAAAGIQRIQGILNGTTNYMLARMEAGATYAEALADAQARGYAEADPEGDVEGRDTAGKLVILANVLMGIPLTLRDVDCQGMTHLSVEDIAAARADGQRWKLLGCVEERDRQISASVRLSRLPLSHPLAAVGGATNAITFTTGLLGDVTLIGPGAGRLETGYALICDLLAIHRKADRQ